MSQNKGKKPRPRRGQGWADPEEHITQTETDHGKPVKDVEPQVSERFGDYRIDGNWLGKVNPRTGRWTRVGLYVRVKERRQDIDTQRVTLVLEYVYDGKVQTHEVNRGSLARNRITELLEFGADVADHKVNDVLAFLNLQESHAPLTSVHTNLGWGTHGKARVFKAWEGIGFDSAYRGPLTLEPKGTYESWKDIVMQHVLGHVPLEFALVVGLSAAVNALLAPTIGIETILVHVHGDSSMGKTTSARVAVSVFGLPSTDAGGLIKHWNGTRNAILGHFKNNHGILLCLDEASMSGSKEFANLVYALASGTDKARMTVDGEIRTPAEWSGTIMSTAEHSLQEKAGQNIGIRMRLLEIGNVSWTQSPKHADDIKAGLLANYGHAGPTFVRHLLAIGEEAVFEVWRRHQQNLVQQMPDADPLSSRIADKYAVFLATVELARQALGLDFDVDGLLAFLLRINQEASQERDIGENAMRHLFQIVTQHHRNFATNEGREEGYELWGKLESEKGVLHKIHIIPSVLKTLLTNVGFEDPGVVLQNWKAKHWLEYDNGKLTRKKTLLPLQGRQLVHSVLVQKALGLDRESPIARGRDSHQSPSSRLDLESQAEVDLKDL